MERDRSLSSTFPLSLMHHVDDRRHTDHEPGGTLANVRSNLLMLHGKGVLHLESLLRHRLQLEVVFDLFLRVPVAATGHARAHAAAVSVSPRQDARVVAHVMHRSPMRPRNRMCVCSHSYHVCSCCMGPRHRHHRCQGLFRCTRHGVGTSRPSQHTLVARLSASSCKSIRTRMNHAHARSWLAASESASSCKVHVHE